MRKLTVALLAVTVALALLGCQDPVSNRSPVEDPVYTVIPAGSLGAYGAIEVAAGSETADNSGVVGVITKKLTTSLSEGLNISAPQVSTDAFTITGTAPLPATQAKTVTVSLNANPGYIFDTDAAYTFGGQSAVVKTAGSVSFTVPYTVVDGSTDSALETLTIGTRGIALSGGSGTVAAPYTGTVEIPFSSSQDLKGELTPRSTSATVTYMINTTGTVSDANNINTSIGSLSSATSLSLSDTNKYLFVKLISAGDSSKYSIYRITVTIAAPKPELTSAYLGSRAINFYGSQAGTSVETAIEGSVHLSGTGSAALSSYSYSEGNNIDWAVTSGGYPAEADYTSSSLSFTPARSTLWIRLRYTQSGDTIASRFYKVQVSLDQELKDPVFVSTSPAYERAVYLYSGKTGDSIGNAKEGTATVPVSTAVTIRANGVSNPGKARVLVQSAGAAVPAPSDINLLLGGGFALSVTDSILWVKIGSWEEDSSGDPLSYTYYKISLTVTSDPPPAAEQFIATYKNSFSSSTLVQLGDDTVQVRGSWVSVNSDVSALAAVNLYVNDEVSLYIGGSTVLNNITVHAQGSGGTPGRKGVLAYNGLPDVITLDTGSPVSVSDLGDLRTSYNTIGATQNTPVSLTINGSTPASTSLGLTGGTAVEGNGNYYTLSGGYYIGVGISSGTVQAACLSDLNNSSSYIAPPSSGSRTFNINVGRLSTSSGLSVSAPLVRVYVTWAP
jgi:hypothetical protein